MTVFTGLVCWYISQLVSSGANTLACTQYHPRCVIEGDSVANSGNQQAAAAGIGTAQKVTNDV